MSELADELARRPAGRPAPSRSAAVWQPSPAMAGWLIAGVLLIVFGLIARRADVAALGVPFLLGVTWTISRRPGRRCRVELEAAAQPAAGSGLLAELHLDPGPGAKLVAVRVAAPGHRGVELLLAARDRTVPLRLTSVRTGRRELFRIDHREASADGLLVTDPVSLPATAVTVLPQVRPLATLPLPFRLQGLTGPHGSRRPGDGGELSDVGPFRPGDRLRRVDWRITSRLNQARGAYAGPTAGSLGSGAPWSGRISELYVRRTYATADATVMLVIDSRDDVGPRLTTWTDASAVREDEATSLDIARNAAATLAAAYLAGGDRVGLEDLGRLRRPVPPAGGRKQQSRLVQRLALSMPEGEPVARRRVPRLPSGALIVVLSTFLDDDAGRMAIGWRQMGHRVVAVDTLPSVVLGAASERTETAYRIIAMERTDRIRALQRAAVEVVSWRLLAEDDPATQLTLLARARMRR